jgi:hypothetical protein
MHDITVPFPGGIKFTVRSLFIYRSASSLSIHSTLAGKYGMLTVRSSIREIVAPTGRIE